MKTNPRYRLNLRAGWVALAAGLTFVAGCTDAATDEPGPNGQDMGRVTGSLSHEGGDQWTHGQASATGQVGADASVRTATLVDVSGTSAVLAETDVNAEGRFSFDSVPPHAGPLAVHIHGDGELVGRAIVATAVTAGAETFVQPVSRETTVETEAFVALRARGEVDAIGLMLFIDADLAANVATGAELADAVEAAQRSFASVAGELRGEAMASAEVSAVRAQAWADLSARLDAGASRAESAQAWADFMTHSAVAFEAEASVSARVHAAATAAAASSFTATLAAEASARATVSARNAAMAEVRLGAWLNAQAQAHAQASAAANVDVELEAEVRAAWAAYLDALGQGTAEAVAEARVALEGSLASSAGGVSATMRAILGLGGAVSGEFVAAAEASAAARATLATELATLTASELSVQARAEASADAWVRFYQALEAAFDGAVAAGLSQAEAELAIAFEASAELHASFEEVLSVVAELEVSVELIINGAIDTAISAVDGAAGLAAGGAIALEQVAEVTVERLDATGRVELARGGVDQATGRFTLNADTFEGEAEVLIAAWDSAGELVAAQLVRVDGGADASAEGNAHVTVPSMDVVSTVEAVLTLERLEAEGQASRGAVALWLDGAVAAAAWLESEGTTALADASLSAEASLEAALSAEIGAEATAALMAEVDSAFGEAVAAGEGWASAAAAARAELEARASIAMAAEVWAAARLEAAVVFEAVTSARGEANLALAARARALIDKAHAFWARFDASVDAGAHAAIVASFETAVEAAIRGTLEATSGADVDAAAAFMADALSVETDVTAEARGALTALFREFTPEPVSTGAAFEAYAQVVTEAAGQLHVAIEAAVVAAATGAERVDAEAVAMASASAFADYRAATSASFETSGLAALDGEGAELRFVAELMASFSASFASF